MALNFYTQGVDVSGLGQGIAQGLQQAANMRMQQEQIVRKEIDDFKSTYDTGKMMAKDTPLFATEFDNYRKTAIEYSKMNRRRVNPSELAAKKSELDAVRGKLNGVYENSAKAASILDGLVKYSDRMTLAGYALPDDMNQAMIILKKTPANEIDLDKIKSPGAYNFKANEKDFTTLDATIKNAAKEGKGSSAVQGKGFTVGLGEKDKPGYKEIEIPEMEQFTSRDALTVHQLVGGSLAADALLRNSASEQKTELLSSLKSTASDADSLIKQQLAKRTQEKILASYPELEGDINNATPAMVIAANRGYLDRIPMGTTVSLKEFNSKLAALNLNMNDANTKERVRIAREKVLGKNSGTSASILAKVVEYGGALWTAEQLEDMGITQAMIKKARAESAALSLMKGYRPGTVSAQ